MPSTGVLLFGDQTTSPFQTIKVLTSRSRDSVLLDTFLQRSLIVLKAHHDALFENGYEKLLCTVLDFADAYAETKERSTALTSALHCIAQLGSIILYVFILYF